jgi:hypothetical protein
MLLTIFDALEATSDLAIACLLVRRAIGEFKTLIFFELVAEIGAGSNFSSVNVGFLVRFGLLLIDEMIFNERLLRFNALLLESAFDGFSSVFFTASSSFRFKDFTFFDVSAFLI